MKSQCILLIYFFLVSQASVAQIGAKVQQQNSLEGTWQNNDFGYRMILVFNPDGTGEFDGEGFKYSLDATTVTLTIEGGDPVSYEKIQYYYHFKSGALQLSGGDLVDPILFAKFDSGQPQISDNSGKTPAVTYTDHVVVSDPTGDITGVWSSNGETIEFKSNEQCVYLGQSYPYKLSGGNVTISSPQGDLTFASKIQNDQLTLSYYGNSVIYTRGSGASGEISQVQKKESGSIDMDLVGKWCYVDVSNTYGSSSSSSSTCITLNADGTYEYHSESSRSVNTPDLYGGTNAQNSDRGTWSVQGDHIFYNSQSQGQGSYTLEKRNHPKNVNDPMIVLDGTAYVSFYNKPPWR